MCWMVYYSGLCGQVIIHGEVVTQLCAGCIIIVVSVDRCLHCVFSPPKGTSRPQSLQKSKSPDLSQLLLWG